MKICLKDVIKLAQTLFDGRAQFGGGYRNDSNSREGGYHRWAELAPAKLAAGHPSFQSTSTMPTNRRSGTGISENRRRRPNLISDQRIQIIAKASAGVVTTKLAEEFDRDPPQYDA